MYKGQNTNTTLHLRATSRKKSRSGELNKYLSEYHHETENMCIDFFTI